MLDRLIGLVLQVCLILGIFWFILAWINQDPGLMETLRVLRLLASQVGL